MQCPHCGNRNPEYFQTNTEPGSRDEPTYLCLAPCEPRDSYLDHLELSDPMRRTCNFQWEPNNG